MPRAPFATTTRGSIGPWGVLMILLFLALCLSLAIAATWYGLSPQRVDTTIVALLVGGLVAATAWAFRRFMTSLEDRAKLLILEALSYNNSMARTEIRRVVLRHSILYRIHSGIYVDALAALQSHGKVSIHQGQYRATLPKASEPQE